MSQKGTNHVHELTPEQRAALLKNLAQDCGWKSAREMKAAVLRERRRHEG
jgi:hypothetical protein